MRIVRDLGKKKVNEIVFFRVLSPLLFGIYLNTHNLKSVSP